MNYDEELVKKMEEIRERVLKKHNINKLDKKVIIPRPKTGKNRDKKASLISDTFGFSRSCLDKWKTGLQGVKRQRMFLLLACIDDEFFLELQDLIKDTHG